MKNYNLKNTVIPKFILLLLFDQIKINSIKKSTFKYITILLCMLFSATNLWSQLPQSCNFRLCSYELVPGYPKQIDNIKDLSGVTYIEGTEPENDRLFMVTNKGPDSTYPYIYETKPDGTVLRSIELKGFEDTEGIVHIEGRRFAVTEEKRGNIAFFEIPPSTSDITIRYSTAEIASMEQGPWRDNNGLEGVTYKKPDNPDRPGTIYTVKEHSDVKYYAFSNPQSFPATITSNNTVEFCSNNAIDIDITNNDDDNDADNIDPFKDVAGIHHLGLTFNGNKDILLLGEKDKTLIQVNEACGTVAHISLDFMCQPEGITMDNNGNIYVVGEYDNIVCENMGKSNEFAILRRNHDVNNDGMVDILDAQNAAQASIGLKAVTNNCDELTPGVLCKSRADMDCNGEINVLDAYNIARLAVGICPN